MELSGTATAARVRDVVEACPAGSFVHSRDLVESLTPSATRAAVDAALARLTTELPLVRMRRGLYYKGTLTRFGVTRPDELRVAYEVCKERGFDDGFGPAGYTAARAFGLTTQVPGVAEVAVPGRCPKDLDAVHFTSRSASSRKGLLPTEVALLEVAREWDRFSAERGWDVFVRAAKAYAETGQVRFGALRSAARKERHLAARDVIERLVAALESPASAL